MFSGVSYLVQILRTPLALWDSMEILLPPDMLNSASGVEWAIRIYIESTSRGSSLILHIMLYDENSTEGTFLFH